MCPKRSRREQSNEGRLLPLLLAALLLLFCSSLRFSGCEARLLPLEPDLENAHRGYGYGRTSRGFGDGDGSSLRRFMREGPAHAPVKAPAASPAHAPHAAPSASPSGAPPLIAGGDPTTGNSASMSKKIGTALFWLVIIGPSAFVILAAITVAAKVRLVVRRRRLEAGTFWKKGISFNENEELKRTSFAGVLSTSREELEAACEEFTNVIGIASDCIVFKGTRPSDGMQIAVKKMQIRPSSWTANREIAFRNKVEDLARMNHENLVNLHAYCASDDPFERMLVFEYASNGTLYEHLHGSHMAADHLDWATRMRIVMGAAYGLQYLHHEINPPASNFRFDASHVFLTEDYAAKVADFGSSAVILDSDKMSQADKKSLGRRTSFKNIVKAFGYNDGYSDWDGYRNIPYLESNMYSFGVFLLEVISGRPPYSDSQGPLIDWARDHLSDPDLMWYLVDPSLKDYNKAELVAVCEVVKMCIQPPNMNPKPPPTMRDVTDMLAKALRMNPDVATRKRSPLLWAERQLLASLDRDEEGRESPSPRHRRFGSQGSQGGSGQGYSIPTWAELGSLSPGNRSPGQRSPRPNKVDESMAIIPPRPKPTKAWLGGANNGSSHRLWADNASELELLSPQEEALSGDEAPLAASLSMHNSSSPTALDSTGRSFRRVWIENSIELPSMSRLSSENRARSSRSDNLDR